MSSNLNIINPKSNEGNIITMVIAQATVSLILIHIYQSISYNGDQFQIGIN